MTDRWTNCSVEETDRAAWEITCGWPEGAGMNVVHRGLDYGELTRWFLWDKVGRAVRRETDPAGDEFEIAALKREPLSEDWPEQGSLPKRLWGAARGFAEALGSRPGRRGRGRPVVFMPRSAYHLEVAAAALRASGAVEVVADCKLPGYEGARRVPRTGRRRAPDYACGKKLHAGIIKGLAALGVELYEYDERLLAEQIRRLLADVRRTEAELEAIRPDAMLMIGDEHPPYQAYVMVGDRMRIPSVVLQHGLDCERYYLDEAYARAIAVWGEARRERYRRDSARQPRYLEVTGNPAYDDLRLPERLDTDGDYWLWVTRPHNPEKCYAPSRSPREGLDILRALLSALEERPSARLVIKPHPVEGAAPYEQHMAGSPAAGRVEVTDTNVHDLIPRARLIISEDSTAGMDAMFHGKVVVFAHFARSEPVTPFVEYGAALAGHSPEMLRDAIVQAEHLDEGRRRSLLEGERAFLTAHAGPLNGSAGERLVSFMLKVISGEREPSKR